MTTLFTMTVNAATSISQGETRRAETELVSYCMKEVEQRIGSGAATSGTIYDRNNTNVGSFTYTPVASK